MVGSDCVKEVQNNFRRLKYTLEDGVVFDFEKCLNLEEAV